MKGLTQNICLILVIQALFFGCSERSTNQTELVENYGVLREIMMEGQLQSRKSLSSFSETPNFFALGAMEGLAGEILVMDGKPSNGVAKNGQLIIHEDFNTGAALLITSEVEEWVEIALTDGINSMDALQKHLSGLDEVDSNQAFPFLIKGEVNSLAWHVINATEATERTHDAYKAAGLSGTLTNETVEILGFYSRNHEGVFTHHGSYLHLHFVNDNKDSMGHVDELDLGQQMKLLLPKSIMP